MTIGIIDDERSECERIKLFVEGLCELKDFDPKVLVYTPDEFRKVITYIESNSMTPLEKGGNSGKQADALDIVIMDIEFKGRDFDGIYLANRLNKVCRSCQIIYLTHILEFAPEVYDTDHCYFVMKNNMDIMLQRAIVKAVHIYTDIVSRKPLEIMSGGHVVYIPQEDIRYIEKEQRRTIIRTGVKSYPCYESISALSKKLSNNMVRCHGGYLVNLSHVTYLGSEKLVMDIPDMEIPVGKTYREQAKQAYLRYWMDRM